MENAHKIKIKGLEKLITIEKTFWNLFLKELNKLDLIHVYIKKVLLSNCQTFEPKYLDYLPSKYFLDTFFGISIKNYTKAQKFDVTHLNFLGHISFP